MQCAKMDGHHSKAAAAAELTQAADPVAEKLVGMNERLDELLLQLGELSDYMPDADDMDNLGKPHKTVTLRSPTSLAENNTIPALQNNNHRTHQSDPVHVSSKDPSSQ